MLLRLIKEDLNKWKIMLCSSVESLSIVKMSDLCKFIYRCNKIPFRISEVLKVNIDEVISKIYMKIWRAKINQDNLDEDRLCGHTRCQTIL